MSNQREEVIYIPRKDNVLVRIIVVDKWGQVAVSQRSAEGKRYVVEAIGPDVKSETLKVGDEVLLGGKVNENWAYLPGRSDLLIINEAAILLTVTRTIIAEPDSLPEPLLKLEDLTDDLGR